MKEIFNKMRASFNEYLFYGAILYFIGITLGKYLGVERVSENYEKYLINGFKGIIVCLAAKEILIVIGSWFGIVPNI